MVIFVSGLVGAGKSTIAKAIAKEIGYPCYEVDKVKREVYQLDPEYQRKYREGIPFPKAIRAKVYERVAADLKRLRDQHEHIVVDEVLYARELRRKLYQTVEDIFGEFIIIWVRVDEAILLDRLRSHKREGHLLEDPVPMHEAIRREFEGFHRSVIVCNNMGKPEDSIASLKKLIIGAAHMAKLMH